MPSPLVYWLPGQQGPQPDLSAVGLSYAFDAPPAVRPLTKGPDGEPGSVIWRATDAANRPLEMLAGIDDYQWSPGPRWPADASRPLVGVARDPAQRPTPTMLARRELLDGVAVRLADGQAWLAPRLRAWDAAAGGYQLALPRQIGVNDAGEWTLGEVLERYALLARHAERLYEGMLLAELTPEDPAAEPGSGPRRLTVLEALDIAGDLLAANYHLGRHEIAALGLLSTGDGVVRSLLEAATDWAAIEQYAEDLERKNPPASAAIGSTAGGGGTT